MEIKLLQIREAKGESVGSPEELVKLMAGEGKLDREAFWTIHLNSNNQIIEKELVSLRILNLSVVHPRGVFKKAIVNGDKSIITVHNHPSGNLSPSSEDMGIWKRLHEAGEIIGIEVLDNIIIIPSGQYYSEKSGKG